MFKILLGLKHWQLFGLSVVSVIGNIIIALGIMFWCNVVIPWMFMVIWFVFPLFFFTCFYLGWFYTLAVNTHKKLPETVKMNLTRFKIIFFIPIVYMVLMNCIMFGALDFIENDFPAFHSLYFGFFLVSICCFVYCLYFNARSFGAAELQRPVTFSDFASEFFLIGFFPLGIWFIQPRVNKMFYARWTVKKIVGVLIWLVIFFIVILASIYEIIREPSWVPGARKKRFDEQVGTYIFDLRRTISIELKLHQDSAYKKEGLFIYGPYAKDSELYKKLTITFKADSTFYLNMSVPFCLDSFGVWETSSGNPDIDGYNLLFFSPDKKWLDHESYAEGDQFGYESKDSTLGINSPTPKKGKVSLYYLFFKKIK